MKNGGSFAASIAEAYFCADSNNQKILTTAFKDLFDKYGAQENINNPTAEIMEYLQQHYISR